MLANFGGKREHVLKRRSVFKRPLAGALDNRPIGERIAEGNAELNHTRTRVDGRQDDLARGGKVGVAAGHVGDEGRLIFQMKGHEGSIEISHKGPFGWWRTHFNHSSEISD